MDSFDSFCFPSLEQCSEKSSCVDEQQIAFADSLLLGSISMHSPAISMSMHAQPQIANSAQAMEQCDVNSNSGMWLPQQAAFPKQELSMAAMYSMMMNVNAPFPGSGNTAGFSVNASDAAPATIMNLLSMANSSASQVGGSSSASMKREDSNSSMADLDDSDSASTASPFSTPDGAVSSDEYPTPGVSPLVQSLPPPPIQTQIKLEVHTAPSGGDEQFAIEIVTPPSNVLETRRAQAAHSNSHGPTLKKRGSPTASSHKKNAHSAKTECAAEQMKAEPLKSSSNKTTKRSSKRSYESSDESDSDEESEDEGRSNSSKQSKAANSSSSSAAGVGECKTRLARKAELARMSRRRKKMRLNDLEKEVKRLHEELAQLQGEAKAKQTNAQADDAVLSNSNSNSTNDKQPTSAVTAVTAPVALLSNSAAAVSDDSDYQQVMALMNDFVSAAKAPVSSADSGYGSPNNVDAVLDLFVSGHAAFLRSGCMHLNALSHQVHSILPFQFLNWLCTQTDAFYQDPSGLWRSLFVDELHLSEDQLNDMDTFRHTVRKQYKHVLEIQKLFKRMSESMQKQSVFSSQNMERIRTVLTPQQFAHFIDWVQKFGEICLKMHQ